MEDYFIQFLEMVEELKSKPYIQILNFELFNGASAYDIAMVEEAIGCELDSSIKEFYQISNGLQLKWIHKNNPSYDPKKHFYEEGCFEDPLEWYGPEDGCINIESVETFLEDWDSIVWFDEDEGYTIEFDKVLYDSLDFFKSIKPLDIFSKSQSMVYFARQGISNPKVLLAIDHFADLEYSRTTNFKSYLQFILETWGLVDERDKYYREYRGSSMPMLIDNSEYLKKRKINLSDLYQ